VAITTSKDVGVEVGLGRASSVDDKAGSNIPAASVVCDGGGEPWVDVAAGEGVVLISAATAVEDAAGEISAAAPLDPKLLDAVVDTPLATWTSLTIITAPSTPVTLTSTVVVPKPLEYSKKLYDCLVVPVHVDPPSMLTSRLEIAPLALTTCMLNQYAETPSLLCNCSGDVIPQSTTDQVTGMTPIVGFARSANASGNRSR
jgi:hypothetical protein